MKLTSNDSASNSDCASVQWSESGFWGSLAAPCFCVTVHGLKEETRVFSRFVSWSWQFAFRDCYSTRPWITINEFPLHPRGNISPSLPSCIQLSLSSHTPACGRGSVRTAVPTESQEDPSSKWSGAFFRKATAAVEACLTGHSALFVGGAMAQYLRGRKTKMGSYYLYPAHF